MSLREVFASFGVTFNDQPLRQGAASVASLTSRMQQLGALLAGNQVVQGIRQFASEFEQGAGRLQDTADQLGTSTTELQQMQFAATAAGISAEQSGAAFARFQQSIAGAAQGAAGPSAAFRALGVQVRDAGGQVGTTSDLFDGAMQALAGIADPTLRAQRAQQLFGRAGARLAIVAHEGAGGVAALRAEFAALGGGITEEAAAAANAYGDVTDRAEVAALSLKSTLAVALLPALTWLVTRATQASAQFAVFARGTHLAREALKLLGAVAAAQAAKMVVAYLPAIAGFVTMALLVGLLVLGFDELNTMLEGGDSALGRFLDKTAGMGTQQRVIQELRDAWEGVKLAVQDAGEWVTSLGTRFEAWVGGVRADTVAIAEGFGLLSTRIGEAFATITDPIRDAFGALATWVESTFGVSFDRIFAKVTELIGRVTGPLGRVASVLHLPEIAQAVGAALGGTVSGAQVALAPVTSAVSGAGRGLNAAADFAHGTADFFHGMRAEWADVFGGHNQALAPPPTLAPGAAGGAVTTQRVSAPGATPRSVTTHRVTHNRIEIHGATDPAATADAVDRRLTQREQAARDANHPVPGSR